MKAGNVILDTNKKYAAMEAEEYIKALKAEMLTELKKEYRMEKKNDWWSSFKKDLVENAGEKEVRLDRGTWYDLMKCATNMGPFDNIYWIKKESEEHVKSFRNEIEAVIKKYRDIDTKRKSEGVTS